MKKLKISIMTLLVAFSTIIGTQTVKAASNEPIEIRTVEDLMAINNDPTASYILMNDIDLSETKKGESLDTGHGWTPIKRFSGVLDGNGYRILNLTMYGDVSTISDSQYDGDSVGGLVDMDVNIESEYGGNFGGICGNVVEYDYDHDAYISKCYVSGSIKSNSEYIHIGG